MASKSHVKMMKRLFLGCRDRICGTIQIARINTVSSRYEDKKIQKPHYLKHEFNNAEELTSHLMNNLIYRDGNVKIYF